MTINPTYCPFCKERNSCQVENINTCWCNNTTIPQALIDLVPTPYQNKSCICFACIAIFNENPVSFKASTLIKYE